jgi:hypothetical protein
MSAVVDAVSSVVGGVVDAVGSVASTVVDVASTAVNTVVKTAENVVQGALNDPIGTLAKVVTAVEAPYLLPVVSAGDVLLHNGDVGQALLSAGTSYVGGQAGNLVGSEVAAATDSPLTGQIVGSGVSGATSAALQGRDPVTGAISGATMSGLNTGLGALPDTTTPTQTANIDYSQGDVNLDALPTQTVGYNLQTGEAQPGDVQSPVTVIANPPEDISTQTGTGYETPLIDNGDGTSSIANPDGSIDTYDNTTGTLISSDTPTVSSGLSAAMPSDIAAPSATSTTPAGGLTAAEPSVAQTDTTTPAGGLTAAEQSVAPTDTTTSATTAQPTADLGTSGLTALDTTNLGNVTPTDLTGISSQAGNTTTQVYDDGSSLTYNTNTGQPVSGTDASGTPFTVSGGTGTYDSSGTQLGGTPSTNFGGGLASSTDVQNLLDANAAAATDTSGANSKDISNILKALLSSGISGTGTTGTGVTGVPSGLQFAQRTMPNLTSDVTAAQQNYSLSGLPTAKMATGGSSTFASHLSSAFGGTPQTSSLTPNVTKANLNYELLGLPVYKADGGVIDHKPQFYSEGGLNSINNLYVKGQGDGTSDSVPAMLATGEFVIPADVVSNLGNGDNDSGAKILDEFLKTIRKHKRAADARQLPPDSKGPLAYLAEAKKKVK